VDASLSAFRRLDVVVPDAGAERVEAALAPLAAAVSRFALEDDASDEITAWRIEALFGRDVDRAVVAARLALATASLGMTTPESAWSEVPDADWLTITRQSFAAIRAGRYHVHGHHLAAASGAIDIRLDAGRAFGSGEHETTRGCLLALDWLARRHRPRRALDLGCGSGLLAIAIAKTWPASVIAADIDPIAVAVARDNARRNRVATVITAIASDGYRAAALRRRAPFDLIAANILARPLVAMAPALARALAPGGVAVLSGLLASQERAVLQAHRRHGLALRRRFAIGAWRTLVIGKR